MRCASLGCSVATSPVLMLLWCMLQGKYVLAIKDLCRCVGHNQCKVEPSGEVAEQLLEEKSLTLWSNWATEVFEV